MTETLVMDSSSFTDIMSEPLSMDEKQARRRAEAAIKKSRELQAKADAAYASAGQAFMDIREGKLYRSTHPTIEAYGKEVWKVGRAHLYRLINAAKVAAILSPQGDIPAQEKVARQLVPLLDNPEKLSSAWEQAMQDAENHARKITANWLNRWLTENQVLQTPTPAQILNHSGKPAAHKPAPKPSTPGDDLLGTPSAGVPVMDEDPWLYVLAALDVANGKPGPGTVRPPLSDARRKMLLRSLNKAISILEGEAVSDPANN
jgi:hypothetical protein